MVIPPAVWGAGLLRARGRGIDTDAWTWRLADAGQLLGEPPSVAGWDDEAWLTTSTYSARWGVAIQAAVLSFSTLSSARPRSLKRIGAPFSYATISER